MSLAFPRVSTPMMLCGLINEVRGASRNEISLLIFVINWCITTCLKHVVLAFDYILPLADQRFHLWNFERLLRKPSDGRCMVEAVLMLYVLRSLRKARSSNCEDRIFEESRRCLVPLVQKYGWLIIAAPTLLSQLWTVIESETLLVDSELFHHATCRRRHVKQTECTLLISRWIKWVLDFCHVSLILLRITILSAMLLSRPHFFHLFLQHLFEN